MPTDASNLQSVIRSPQAKPVIGLVGGIGSGKTTVAAAFGRHGGKVISGDQLGHEALGQPDVEAVVRRRWGDGVLHPDGSVNRRRLGARVFAEPAELRELEQLVFPWIERRIREEIAAARADPAVAFIVLDAAVMLEAGWNKVCDWLVYIDVPRPQRLQRLRQQRGWSEEEVSARERAQLATTEKAARADFSVDNSGPPEQTARQVDELLQHWQRAGRLTMS